MFTRRIELQNAFPVLFSVRSSTKSIKPMLSLVLVAAPILAALTWVVFNIQGPAKDQWRSMD